MSLELVKEKAFMMREGNHDKVYYMQMYRDDSILTDIAYLVNFQFGRREWGTNLNTGTKTPGGPVHFFEAEKIFNKMVREKERKGYLSFDSKESLNVWNTLAF